MPVQIGLLGGCQEGAGLLADALKQRCPSPTLLLLYLEFDLNLKYKVWLPVLFLIPTF